MANYSADHQNIINLNPHFTFFIEIGFLSVVFHLCQPALVSLL